MGWLSGWFVRQPILSYCNLCKQTYSIPASVRTMSQWENVHFKACATREILKQLED